VSAAGTPCGELGRADLLRVLRVLSDDPSGSGIDARFVEALGFEMLETLAPSGFSPDLPPVPRSVQTEIDAPEPLRATAIWVCERRERLAERPPAPETTMPAPIARAIRSPPRVPPPSDAGRLQPLWDRVFAGTAHTRDLDVPRIVRLLAEATPIRHLPRRVRPELTSDLCVVLDRRDRLRPIWGLQWLMCQRLRELLPREQCRVLTLRSEPGHWLQQLRRTGGPDGAWPEENDILIVSDFDQLGDDVRSSSAAWRELIDTFSAFGNRVVTLGTAGQAPHRDTEHVDMFDTAPSSVIDDALLAAMARFHLPKIEQLHTLRLALSRERRCGIGNEIRIWNHPEAQVNEAGQWSLRPEYLERRVTAFERLERTVREALDAPIARWRESWPASKVGLEGLIDATGGLATGYEAGLFTDVLQAAERTRVDKDHLDHWLLGALGAIEFVVSRYRHDPPLQALYEAAQRVALASGVAPPLGLAKLEGAISSEVSFTQVGDALEIREIDDETHSESATRPRLPILRCEGPVLAERTGRVVRACVTERGERRTFETLDERFELVRMRTPEWAASYWRDAAGGVHAEHVDGVQFRYVEPGPENVNAHWQCVDDGWSWASGEGVDEYGLWVEFTVEGIIQRLRWIPPGEFLMGSPEEEEGRNDAETLHRVTLTVGYWMAETACTHGLWDAVTGVNPSRFKGVDYPVEQVSWDDVQGFVKGLNERLPDLHARLPTEAEWEYAARAGTRTAFWWGDELTTDQANYNGNHPYPEGGEKGEYREETLKVKTFEANPWGLYQVHGNVREWCQDQYGEYSEGEQVNPTGPEAGVSRVLRGGGWGGLGRHLRAADRVRLGRDDGHDFLGFRLAAGH